MQNPGPAIQGTALHNTNALMIEETMISQPAFADEAYRNRVEALKANPEAARKLSRNQKLWVYVPAAVCIILVVIVYLL